MKPSQYLEWKPEHLAPNKDFLQGKCDKEVQDKILGGSQDLWLPQKILRRANKIHIPGQNIGWEPELLAPTKDFEKGQLNTHVQAKFELHGSKIPSFFKMLKKIGYARKNIICTALYLYKQTQWSAGQQKEHLENIQFSPKLPSYITFCHPGFTDYCTNQFLVKF